MTTEQTRRVEQAIRETYACLQSELKYLPKFRNQSAIDGFCAHLDNLQAMLPPLSTDAKFAALRAALG